MKLVAAVTAGLEVRGKWERRSELGFWPWSARGYHWDRSLSEEDEGKEGKRRPSCRDRGNGLRCKWLYQLRSLSGAAHCLGNEHVVKANAPIWAGCGKISLLFTPFHGFFLSSLLTFLP